MIALWLAGCAGTPTGPKSEHAQLRHHGVHSVWRTATVGRSATSTRKSVHHEKSAHDRSPESGSTVMASYYHPTETANGERIEPEGLTAAHRTLPFGTRVRVTNLNNHRSVTVRINDRGPFVSNRSIDLSDSAATAIGMTSSGVAHVRMEVLQ
jgi:rare lipoprotein A